MSVSCAASNKSSSCFASCVREFRNMCALIIDQRSVSRPNFGIPNGSKALATVSWPLLSLMDYLFTARRQAGKRPAHVGTDGQT
jgi:hypothetical protein